MTNTATNYIEKNPVQKKSPLMAGGGVGLLKEKRSPALLRRIEMLGRLNDRRLKYMAKGYGRGLARLSAEYRRVGVRDMANRVRIDAEGL